MGQGGVEQILSMGKWLSKLGHFRTMKYLLVRKQKQQTIDTRNWDDFMRITLNERASFKWLHTMSSTFLNII